MHIFRHSLIFNITSLKTAIQYNNSSLFLSFFFFSVPFSFYGFTTKESCYFFLWIIFSNNRLLFMVQSLNIFILKISIIACLKNIVYLRKKNQLCSYMKKKFISYNKIYSVLLESKGGWLVACVAYY